MIRPLTEPSITIILGLVGDSSVLTAHPSREFVTINGRLLSMVTDSEGIKTLVINDP